MLPVGPFALASLASEDGEHELLAADVEQANLLQCQRAMTQVVVRPGSGLGDWVLARHQEYLDHIAE